MSGSARLAWALAQLPLLCVSCISHGPSILPLATCVPPPASAGISVLFDPNTTDLSQAMGLFGAGALVTSQTLVRQASPTHSNLAQAACRSHPLP